MKTIKYKVHLTFAFFLKKKLTFHLSEYFRTKE